MVYKIKLNNFVLNLYLKENQPFLLSIYKSELPQILALNTTKHLTMQKNFF